MWRAPLITVQWNGSRCSARADCCSPCALAACWCSCAPRLDIAGATRSTGRRAQCHPRPERRRRGRDDFRPIDYSRRERRSGAASRIWTPSEEHGRTRACRGEPEQEQEAKMRSEEDGGGQQSKEVRELTRRSEGISTGVGYELTRCARRTLPSPLSSRFCGMTTCKRRTA